MWNTECPYAQRVCICIMISQSIISHLNSQSSVLVFEIAIVILPIFKKRKGNFEAINWISHRPIVRTCKNRLCWPKTKRLSSSSPAKMSLLGISRELQRRVCNHGKPPGSSRKPRARELFHRKEVNFERTLVSKESMTFHWLHPLQEGRGVLLLPVGLCYSHQHESSLFSVLSTVFNWVFRNWI